MMYGFASAAAMRNSTRWELSLPVMTRSAQVRLSTPQLASVGAQKPGISRVNALTVGAIMASSSPMSFCWPPTKWRMVSLM